MNERILELAQQAGLKFPSETAVSPQEQKFAELIVQECLLAISKTPVQDDEITTMVKCHTQVEKHFGVE